jgi:hypothetical protein
MGDDQATVAPLAPVPDPDAAMHQARREEAARAFDLASVLIKDEYPDPPQCPFCGRFRGVQMSPDKAQMRCPSCREVWQWTGLQPDTIVRTVPVEPTAADGPPPPPAPSPSAQAPGPAHQPLSSEQPPS